jgi:hypothetical protein
METFALVTRILAVALAGFAVGCALGGANWLLWGITGVSVACAVYQVATLVIMCQARPRVDMGSEWPTGTKGPRQR